MKKFRFRLQSVLDYRTDQLDLVQQKVAQEESKRLDLLKRIQEYDEAIEHAFQEQQRLLDTPALDLNTVQNFPNYIWRLKQFRFQEFQALQQQETILATVREELKQALIKKKSLDVLKEKEHTRYRKKLEKAEEEFLSEITLNRMSRQSIPQ